MGFRAAETQLATGYVAQAAIDSVGTSFKDLWNHSADLTWPTAGVLQLSSSSAADAAAGTGALTVKVEGLSATRAMISELVTLNGQTGVATVASFLRVNSVQVITAGSGGVNAGDIYVATAAAALTAGVPNTAADVVRKVSATQGSDQAAIFSTPAGKRLMVRLSASATAPAIVELYMRTAAGVLVLLHRMSTSGPQVVSPIVLAGTAVDIVAKGKAMSSTATITATIETWRESAV